MSCSHKRTTGLFIPQARALRALSVALTLLPAANLRADETSVRTHIKWTGTSWEGQALFQLEWAAWSNATYLVQSATNLAAAGAWQTVDLATPTSSAGMLEIKGRSIPENSAEFFRLILPQPQIFSVEPAVVAPGAAVDFYVAGQCFGTNVGLTVNGVPQPGVVFSNTSSAVLPAFTPDLAGSYRFDLVAGGQVVSSFTMVCADALATPELVLQGPPTEPPAQPSAAWLSKRGYDYYKAASDLTAAGLQSNPFFQDNQHAGEMPQALMAVFLSKRGYDYYQARSDVTYEVQEGKKGLNAVNVKLARMAGGGGGGRINFFHAWPSSYHPPALNSRAAGKRTLWGLGGNVDLAGRAAVIPFSGEVQACEVDLTIPGRGLDFIWARTYRSRTGSATSMGQRWTHSYDVQAAQSSASCTVSDGTGRRDLYAGTNGVYTCPQFFREGTLSNNTFTLTFADTGRWVFNPFDGTATAGKLARIVDRNGNTMTLGYDLSGRLTQVVDDLGRTNTVAYTNGYVASVTDFTGRSVTYQYYQGLKADNGGPGDLKSVTSPPVTGTPNGNDFPAGKTTTYTYSKSSPLDRENHLLLTVTDPKGQPAAGFSYELSAADPATYLHCTAAQKGSNPPFTYSWSLVSRPAGSLAVTRCIVNDPVGNVTEGYFDARGRCVMERDYTGRATPGLPVTPTLNRPAGKLRAGDPDYYETRCNWNSDSLCTLEISPGGQQVQYIYESDFDKSAPARKRADCRVVRELAAGGVDLNGDGTADVTERVWRYEYDPRFGSDPAASRLRSGVIAEVGAGRPAPADRLQGGAPGSYPDLGATPGMDRLGRPAINTALNFDAGAPTVNEHAVKTKGTGANARRMASLDSKGSGHLVEDLIPTQPGGGSSGSPAAVTFGREKLKATTKTQGDFNLSNRSFVTSATDPRGNGTSTSYDAKGNPTRVTLATSACGANAPTVDLAYDNQGQLTTLTHLPDANCSRRVDTFTWSQGQMTQRVVDAAGLAITESYEYDSRGNLTRYVDPRTNEWLCTYNSLDQQVQSSSATLSLCFCKIKVDYNYDAKDNLVQCATDLVDAAGTSQGRRTDSYHYDGLDRLSEITLAADATHALTNRFVYDGNDQCVQVLGPDAVSGSDPHQALACEYDERGLLFRAITAPGSALTATNEFGYNANGDAVSRGVHTIDGLESETDFAYDGFGRPAAITDAMGNQTFYFYDANDNLRVVRALGELNDVPGSAGNVRLAESHYDCDGLDRCVRAHDLFFDPATQLPIGSGEAVASCVYAPNGECASVTDSLGRTTSFGYDTAGRLSSVTDARGNLVVSVRDSFGNVTSVTRTELPDVAGGPQVFGTAYAYDAWNRCVSSSDNVGNTLSCAYDSLSRLVRITDPNGNDTTYAYDLLDNCLATTDYAGSSSAKPAIIVRSSQATYDTSSRCLTATDADGNITRYAYDSLSRPTTATSADGTQHKLIWSPRSNLVTETDANGTTITNVYDPGDRLVHRDIAARGPAAATTTFETFAYDGGSRLVLASNDVSRLDFHYDSFGDCTRSTQDGLAQSTTFDSEGNPLSLTYPSGRVVTYTYDALDQVTNTATLSGGVSHPQLARFAYAGPGRLARIGRDNGINTRMNWDGLANPANPAGDYGWQQISEVSHQNASGTVVVDRRTARFDPNQNRTQRTQTAPFYPGGDLTTNTFEYDALSRLHQAETLRSQALSYRLTTYALDPEGNRQHVATNGLIMLPDYSMSSALPPGDSLMNRYTTTPFGEQQYDANGNLVARSSADRVTHYRYDYADRLVEAETWSATGTNVLTLAYDPLGRRVASVSEAKPMAPRETRRTFGGGSRSRVIEERVGGALSQVFVHAGGLSEEIRENDRVAFTAGGEAHYFHCDDLGNTLALTDSGGNVLERYDYDDYGRPQFLSADGTPLVDSTGQPVTASPLGNSFLFHGLEWDGETGLLGDGSGDYFDPQTGRAVRGKVKTVKDMGHGRAFDGNNPWSGGGEGGEMKKGTVKFFNEAKGFRSASGSPPTPAASKHYITIPHNLSRSSAAYKHYITIPHNN